jgi:hypothetical protein
LFLAAVEKHGFLKVDVYKDGARKIGQNKDVEEWFFPFFLKFDHALSKSVENLSPAGSSFNNAGLRSCFWQQ